jgi:hypothetical protein
MERERRGMIVDSGSHFVGEREDRRMGGGV